MKRIFMLVFLSFLIPTANAEINIQCMKRLPAVLDKFIDPYRVGLDKCEKAEDCTWQTGGTGVHVNKTNYSKFESCFLQATNIGAAICLQGKNYGKDGAPMPLIDIDPSIRPKSYSCVRSRCVPHYEYENGKKMSSNKPLWNLDGIKEEDRSDSKEVIGCIKKAKRILPLKLLK